jgi:hypothetical protein
MWGIITSRQTFRLIFKGKVFSVAEVSCPRILFRKTDDRKIIQGCEQRTVTLKSTDMYQVMD